MQCHEVAVCLCSNPLNERAHWAAFLHCLLEFLFNLLFAVDRKWALQRQETRGGAFAEPSRMLAGWEVFPFHPRNRGDSSYVPGEALRILPRHTEIRKRRVSGQRKEKGTSMVGYDLNLLTDSCYLLRNKNATVADGFLQSIKRWRQFTFLFPAVLSSIRNWSNDLSA